MELFVEMGSRGFQADVITCGVTISACEKGKEWQRFLGLFKEMRSQRLQADVIQSAATMSACEKGRQ